MSASMTLFLKVLNDIKYLGKKILYKLILMIGFTCKLNEGLIMNILKKIEVHIISANL